MKKPMLLPLALFVIIAALGGSTILVAQAQQPQASVAAPADDNLQKGIQLNTAKQYSQAEAALRAAVAAHPESADAHLQLAIALFEQNKVADAANEINLAAPLAQGTQKQQADFYRYRGSIYTKQQKYTEAVQDLEKATKLDPMQPYGHYYLGVAYGKTNRADKMVDELQMFLKLAPNAPEAPKVKALLSAVQ